MLLVAGRATVFVAAVSIAVVSIVVEVGDTQFCGVMDRRMMG